MNIIAILSGALVGFTLGLVGGGGSVLATPLLLYAIVGLSPHVAIGTGAFAVAVNAFLNFFAQVRSGRIIWTSAIIFAVFGSLGAFFGSSVGKAMNGDKLIFLFGLAMLGLGAAMLRPIEPKLDSKGQFTASVTKSALVAIGVGCLAGFFGIGGGVLIVPGLVLATRMPMLNAISTSLLAVGSFGVTTAVNYAVSGLVDWMIALQFIGGGFLGGFLGIRSGVYLSRYKGALNKAFAILTFSVATYVLYRSGSAIFGPQLSAPQIAAVEKAEPVVPAPDAGPAIRIKPQPAPPKMEEDATAELKADGALSPDQAGSGIEDRAAAGKLANEAGSTSAGKRAPQTGEDQARPAGAEPEAVTREGPPASQPSAKQAELDVPATGVEAKLAAFLAGDEKSLNPVTWFDLDRVRFDAGKMRPRPDSEGQLRTIAAILSAYPDTRAIIGGHTDDVGDARRNKRLSELRAGYVLRELIRMGVDASRLEARGYAADHPSAPNRTAAGRAKNRRVSLGVMRD